MFLLFVSLLSIFVGISISVASLQENDFRHSAAGVVTKHCAELN